MANTVVFSKGSIMFLIMIINNNSFEILYFYVKYILSVVTSKMEYFVGVQSRNNV